jgi:DNA-binding transcriptional ArsR family regulator
VSGEGEAQAARFFQALGDPTRLALLAALREGERNVTELVDALGCPQPKVSRHLKVLKEAGLVRDRRDGRHVGYALATSKAWPAEARRWLEALEPGLPLREPGSARRREPDRTRATTAAARADEPASAATVGVVERQEATRPRPRADVEAHLL